ncbi:MAG TPA: family 20 glycosylhydrolase [Opitutaceae bacterium]|nr:family 20 glycosylhydrolase [Opitutaceae bacterium]
MLRAFQWDLARQVERLDWLLAQLPRYAGWGYQELYLHLEDAVEYPSLPGVARADAYSYRDLEKLVAAAGRCGLKVVPIVNLLGHTQYLIKVPGLRDLNELRASDGTPLERGQICPVHPRTLEVADRLLHDMAPFCTAGKVHVGLDESIHLGRHPLSRAEIAEIGLAAHFGRYVQRLHGLAGGLGLRLGLWADMLSLLPDAIPLLPPGTIAYDWYYYPFARHPRVELRNFAECDLATPLRAQGVEYWGCPMNGAFRHEPLPIFGDRLANLHSWWTRCQRVDAAGFLVTSWEASRLALEMTTVIDAAAAGLWLEPEIDHQSDMLSRGFARVFGRRRPRSAGVSTAAGKCRPEACATAQSWARAALAGDAYAHAGYARWEINDRWDVGAPRQGLTTCEREERFCGRLQTRAAEEGWPAPFAASVAFRHYLAQRDVFVRKAAGGVWRLRRLLAKNRAESSLPPRRVRDNAPYHLIDQLRKEAVVFTTALRTGRKAARVMWARTRDPRQRGPNEQMLAADAARLRAWQRWLARAAQRPAIVRQATPVCGAWQLQFTVHNFAPALQRVVVERSRTNGTWEELYGRYLIEFRAYAARPRTRIKREFSVPVPVAAVYDRRLVGEGRRSQTAATGAQTTTTTAIEYLRLAVRGLGQVAISHVELTDGVTTLRPAGWRLTQKKILGRPAPRQGFPELDLGCNQGEVALRFAG